MTRARILIIEDERIVARDIGNRVIGLGYEVVGAARSGEDAVRLSERLRPDLVLMDIRLEGAVDGVAAAQEIRSRLHLPVVYLTAYADEHTLQRARVTEPFGYVLKPFDERELHTAIEMALYKHQAECKLRTSDDERRRAAAELVLFRALIDRANDTIEVIDPETGRFLDVNEQAPRAHGYSREEYLELHVPDVADLPGGWSSVAMRMDELKATGSWLFESSRRQKDGSTFPVEVNATHIRLERDYLVFVARDISGRKRAQETLRQAEEKRKILEERVLMAQKMEAVGRLAGGVAHDFNNLLTVINGCTAMLVNQLGPAGQSRELLVEIRKAGERAAALTRQLLVFARKQPAKSRATDLDELVGETAQMLRWLTGEHIDLTVRRTPGLGLVEMDPGQLEQVLMNLVINARDAMPEGGCITIETRDVELSTSHADAHPDARPGRHARLTVSDTGNGMDEATLARIYEPFFTTKAVGQGTGLGLSLVHGIVRQGGGHIEVSSQMGRGTTFSIYLPVLEARVACASPLPGMASTGRLEIPRGDETVLLVDDDDGVRRLLRTVLHSSGYRVLEARDGEEALEVARRSTEPIQLLLTDVVMPRMGGQKLAALLSAERPELKTLFVSGYTTEDMGSPGVLRPGEQFLPKPFTPSILARKVREVLDTG